MFSGSNSWTPEQDAAIEQGIARGLSANQISVIYAHLLNGRSRSAILGRCWRLQIRLNHNKSGKTAFWQEKRISELRKMYNSGLGYTRREIAQIMGINRNQLSKGICLLRKIDNVSKNLNPKRFKRGAYAVRSRIVPKAAPAGAIRLEALRSHHCRYPVTDGKPFLFCGAGKLEHSSYCPQHHLLCHRNVEFSVESSPQSV